MDEEDGGLRKALVTGTQDEQDIRSLAPPNRLIRILHSVRSAGLCQNQASKPPALVTAVLSGLRRRRRTGDTGPRVPPET